MPATMTESRHRVVDSPLGPLTLEARDGALAGVWMDGSRHHPTTETLGEADADEPVLQAAASQLEEYFAGQRTSFDVPLALEGTDFQREVWRALTEIPCGTTASYGEIAVRIGRPRAVRAVGMAVGRNPVSVVVPCHRVIGADGTLTGFGGGLDRKRLLLEHEGALPAGA